MAEFMDVFSDVTSLGRKLQTNEYNQSGLHPIIDQGQNDIAGYTDEIDGLFTDVPVIIFGDHTRVIKYVDKPFFLGADGVKVLKAKIPSPNYKYLYYCLQNAKIPNTGYNRHFKWIKEVQIPLPSPDYQFHIAAVLDKVSELIAMRKKQLAKLDELVKSRFIELFGDPVSNPMNWNKLQLQDVVTDDCTISYGIVQTGDEQETGIPVFRPIDIVNRTPKLEELKKTTKEISDKYKRTILKGREILITVRANIADTCIVGEEFAGCNVGRGIVPIRTKENIIILEFLKHQIDSKGLNDAIKGLAKGIALVQLNMEDLREIELIIPPLESQKNFISFANQIDKLIFKIREALEKLETLKKALMQKYFG